MHTLIGGIGYFHQEDLSLGLRLLDELSQEAWSAEVELEDLSYGPIGVVHRLHDALPALQRVVLFGAVDRGRPSGEVHYYRWDGALPPAEEIQERVGEALTGVVDLSNLLVVAGQFRALPAEVYVIEVQPVSSGSGGELSPRIAAELPRLRWLARLLAESPAAELERWLRLPGPLPAVN